MSPTQGLAGHLLLLILTLAAFGFFALRAFRLYRLMRVGQPDNRFDDPGARLRDVAIYVLGQRRLLRQPLAGAIHALIFWGFIVITLGTTQLLFSGITGLSLPLIAGDPVFAWLLDLMALLVLVAIGAATYRRLVLRPARLDNTRDAALILSLIALLMVTLLLAEAFAIVAQRSDVAQAQWVAGLLAHPLAVVGAGTAVTLFAVCWWLHLLTVLGFATYLPFSKHLHIVGAMFSVYFRPSTPRGALPLIANIEEAERFGVSKIDQFGWKDLLDLTICTQCGRCDRNCPALLSDKPLSPKMVIHDLKDHLFDQASTLLTTSPAPRLNLPVPALAALANGPAVRSQPTESSAAKPQRMVGDVIKDETLWACTTCGWCVEGCPVFIEHVPKIMEMRRHLVLEEENRFPSEVIAVFNNLERNGNPWQYAQNSRDEWARGLGVQTMAEVASAGSEIDVLYFVGCMGSYDSRNRKVATAVVKALQAAHVRFAILGKEEGCTGDPARRIGNEYLYQMLAQANIETLNGYGVKTVLTACAHCFNTIKNEYPQLGGSYEVVHHSQYLDRLIAEGRLPALTNASVSAEGVSQTVTFHDPCYLGRYNKIYDEPRKVLKTLPMTTTTEMARSRSGSFCCGGGGGRSFMDEREGKRINVMRVQQAMEVKPDIIAAACPFCITMFEDGVKAVGVENTVQIRDISELVVATLEQQDAGSQQAQ